MNRNSAVMLSALAILLGMPSTAAFASDFSAPIVANERQAVPAILSDKQKQFYSRVLAAIRSQRWDEAKSLLDSNDDGPLYAFLRAELLVAANSPRAELNDIMPLLTKEPEIPQAAQLARLALKRGATSLPDLPATNQLTWSGSAPRRLGADPIIGDPFAMSLEKNVPDRIKNDDPAGAEGLLNAVKDRLSPESRDEWCQKIAWSYYIENDDANALRLASESANGRSNWSTQAAWVVGLASWRTQDYRTALSAFDRVGREAPDSELRAAGYYWASRAAMASGEPSGVQNRLRAAAANPETLYGLLAAESLGEAPNKDDPLKQTNRHAWRALEKLPNVRAAIALSELGEDSYAGETLRHQARIGRPEQHEMLITMAEALNLPETQLYLAHNTPNGRKLAVENRYPQPQWVPTNGWKVDPALVFAHTLQESRFRREVVSPAGAYGLMQVRPGTAKDLARWRGESIDTRDLRIPAVNMDFGQSYLEYLSHDSSTGGLLPKVIAAYNAGPAPVARWATEVKDQGDPLLFIESIPYWETRGYVGTVLRNYWMYEAQEGRKSISRSELAQGKWPRFPELNGRVQISYASPGTSKD